MNNQEYILKSEIDAILDAKIKMAEMIQDEGLKQFVVGGFTHAKNQIRNLSGVSDTSKVTRVEVIDEHGRAWTTYNASNVRIDLQDDDRTLKLFLTSNK